MHRTALGLAAGLVAAVVATQAVASDAPPAGRAAAAKGFSVTPSLLETTARSGASGSVTVNNSSGVALKVNVRARPWKQALSGAVAADRRRSLAGARVNVSSFTMPAGAQRTVSLALVGLPRAGSLFGALEVVGAPTKKRAGVNVNYRLVSSVRFNPAGGARRYRLSTGAVRVSGRGSGRAVVMRVRNGGNTVETVSGTASLSGPGSGRSGAVAPVRILPGKQVDVRLAAASGLRAGAYRATVRLSQGGSLRARATRGFRIG